MLDPSAFAPLPLLADGGVAHALAREPATGAQGVEALNQSRPQAVQALHARYVAAGARLLRTNTALGCAAHLAPAGLADRAEAINNSGSALARRALGPGGARPPGAAPGAAAPTESVPRLAPAQGFVMGTLAPPPQAGLLERPEWRRAYGEQIVYLSDTEVDFFLLQHCTRLADALALTQRVRQVSDAPVLAALQLDAAGRTEDGHDAASAGAALAAAGAGALGLCCGPGPAALAACVEALLGHGLPVAVLAGLDDGAGPPPYAGAPRLDPAGFAAWLAPLAARGVAILGGCCGAGPEHIAALARALGRG
jgi:methionine synthase I (cobalamin-dependent)